MENLKTKVKNMRLSNIVSFWGRIDDIGNAYRNTDVLILPSIWPENQPVTITEAMASKIRLLVQNSGGIPELIEDGKTVRFLNREIRKTLPKKCQILCYIRRK